jgi:type II secretory pathway pseudopilin PulG
MKFSPRTIQSAFSLIEMMIVIAVGTTMLIILGILIFNFNKTSLYQQTLVQSSGSANVFVREIKFLALPASAVLQTHTFSSATHTSTTTSLVLQIPSTNSSGSIIANTYDYAAFYVVGTNAYRLLETDALSTRTSGTKLLSSTISALAFTYNNASFPAIDTITVDIQTQASTTQEILTDHRIEQIRLRNH